MNEKRIHNKKGSVLVLFVVMLALLMLSLAIVVDLGWILTAKSQLQNAADSASLAAASRLLDEDILQNNPDQTDDVIDARNFAEQYAGLNQAGNCYIALDRNDSNAISGGIVAGYIDNPLDMSSPFQTAEITEYNSVKVRAERSAQVNGLLELFLGQITGQNTVEVAAEATASLDDRIIGFALRTSEEKLPMLPFTIHKYTWEAAINGDEPLVDNPCPDVPDEDHYAYINGEVVSGCQDGVPEVKLFPYKTMTCGQQDIAGNFGTLDIGYSSNSTSDLVRQIENGITQSDLEAIDGLFMADTDGDGVPSKWLQGDTGVSNGIKTSLDGIAGQVRLIPLYEQAWGNGNGAEFEIVRFVGVRIMDVQLTGQLEERCVLVQPAMAVTRHAVVDVSAPRSQFIYALALTR